MERLRKCCPCPSATSMMLYMHPLCQLVLPPWRCRCTPAGRGALEDHVVRVLRVVLRLDGQSNHVFLLELYWTCRKNDHDQYIYDIKAHTVKATTSHWMSGSTEKTEAVLEGV